MRYDDYEYDYHNLAENADDLYECDYSDEETDPSWTSVDNDENEVMDSKAWEHYYHDLADDIDD